MVPLGKYEDCTGLAHIPHVPICGPRLLVIVSSISQVNVELPEAARLQAEIEEKEGQVGMLEHHIQNLEMQIYRYEIDYIVHGDGARTSSSPL